MGEYLQFEHLQPKTIREACLLLSRYKEKARVFAGGTDLIILKKSGQVSLQYMIDIKSMPNLNYVHHVDGEDLKIGALATIHDIESSTVIRVRFPALASAAQQMGSPQIRNMATIGGNICRAAPSADMAPPLIGLGARVKITSLGMERTIDIERFFLGPGETALRSNEILTEIQIPTPSINTGGAYLKWMPKTQRSIAVIGVAVVVSMDSDRSSIVDAKIVLGAVAPTPVRAFKAEGIIMGKVIEDKLMDEAAEAASMEAKPITDIRGTAEYRRNMVKVLVRRAIIQAVASIK